MGFLKNESLRLIVDAPRDNRIHSTLDFRQNTTQSMQINKSGLLVRVLIAAKFDHTISSGWPVLQIRRALNGDNSSHLTPINTSKEPRPTGYLNVFEYDMQAVRFEVQCDDSLRVYWPPKATPDGRRYSLAYLRESSEVMVSIEVQHQNQTLTTCHDSSVSTTIPPITIMGSSYSTTEIAVTTMASSNSSTKDLDRSGNVATIVGGVLCTIAVIILLVVLTIAVFLVYRSRNHTKEFSPTANDLYTSVLPRSSGPTLQNPTYSLVDSEIQ